MRCCGVVGSVFAAGFVLGLSAVSGIPAPASAQAEVQLAQRAPRFFLARSPSATPTEVDAHSLPMLRRRITVDVDGATVEAALIRISEAAGLRIVYSKSVVSLEGRVHLRASDITVAAALIAVLLDTDMDVLMTADGKAVLSRRERVATAREVENGTVIGRVTDAKTGVGLSGAEVVIDGTKWRATTAQDGRYRLGDIVPGSYSVRARYIGYAPGVASVTVGGGQEATADFALEKAVQKLEEVVTTGTVVPTEVKALPTPISVITAEDIQRQNLQRVDRIFRGQVPGAIAFDQGAGQSDYVSVVNVRGASGFTPAANSIKTFVDGVEVADPSFISTIDPSSVDRIEVTRGPQASTLYGAGALNGVMQIFTKRGQLGLARPEVTAKVSAGGIGGFNGQSTALQTDNAVGVVGGSEKTSYNLGAAYRHEGEWLPTYHKRSWSLSAGGQTSHGPLRLSGSARYGDGTLDEPWDTRLRAYTLFSQPVNARDQLQQQTYGLTATLRATRSWQHTLTLGYDQTNIGILRTQARFTTPDDSFLSVFLRRDVATSVLYHTDLSLRFGATIGAIVTAGVNYATYDFSLSDTEGATRTTGSLDGSSFVFRTPYSSTGYFGQVLLNIDDRLFLSGGLRAERNDNFGSDFGTAWSPRVGAAYSLAVGSVRVKLRASYGEGIRAPGPGQRSPASNIYQTFLDNPHLAPERQRGGDGGVEVYLGRASIGVTYYAQRAINLIDNVLIAAAPGAPPTYQWQNISRVKNDGWEFEAQLPLGPMQLSGTYSIVNSTIQVLPPNYPAGGYQVGDPIVQIPHASAGATATFSPLPQTTLTATVTHFGHWIANDDIALYGFYFGNQPYRGSDRAYWMEYPTVTKLAIGVSQVLTKQITCFARAENVGNNLRFESSNLQIPTPRSVLVGATVRY